MGPALALGVALPLLLAPDAAQACAVCFAGKADGARIAFIATTGLLTAMPFVLLGAGLWWIRKRLRADEAAQEAHRGAGGAAPAAATAPDRPEGERTPAQA